MRTAALVLLALFLIAGPQEAPAQRYSSPSVHVTGHDALESGEAPALPARGLFD